MSDLTATHPRIIRLDEVKKITGLSRSTIYAFVKSGTFPATIPLGPRAVGWLEHEINAWIEKKTMQRAGAK